MNSTIYDQRRAKLIEGLRTRGIGDERVLAVMSSVPRERFVPEHLLDEAYIDNALPVGCGQTISQPFVVALMTQMLRLTGDETVLEVGTGTGYQTAILAKLASRVVTIERIPELAEAARETLDSCGVTNVAYRTGDGTLGWPDDAPYDAVIVTAGAPDVPSPLYNQLRPGGRMVIPVGDAESQTLTLIVKGEGGPDMTEAGGCRFVKLIGDAGWEHSEC